MMTTRIVSVKSLFVTMHTKQIQTGEVAEMTERSFEPNEHQHKLHFQKIAGCDSPSQQNRSRGRNDERS